MLITQQPRIKTNWSPTGRRENSQDYYVVRDAVADYSDYWEPKADPDGVIRDRNTDAERRQYIEDVRYIIDFVNELDPHSVLDIGSGPGWLLNEITYRASKYAIEPCVAARKYINNNEILMYDTLEEVPSCCKDVIIAHHVFEHLKDPIDTINHVRRILCPGGYLVLGTPDFGSPCAKRFGDNYRMLHDKTHCSLFTLESMTRMLRDHGFTIHDVQFPFPQRYATAENFLRWNDTSKVSPAWPGNWMSFFCRRGSR